MRARACAATAGKALALRLRATRWLFVALCAYLAAQCFMIPVLTIGPSWAIWPRLADLALGLMVLAFLGCWQWLPRASLPNERLFYLFLLTLTACAISYVAYLAFVGHEAGTIDGGYYLYRSAQFVCIFALASRVPLTDARVRAMRVIVDVVYVFVCVMVILTYFAVVPLGVLTAHLPQGHSIGLWYLYGLLSGQSGFGYGTISYNHAYTAAQILLLVGLRMHLGTDRSDLSHSLMLLLGIVACFVSESRAGLVAILILAAVHFARRPVVTLAASGLGLLLLVVVEMFTPRTDDAMLGASMEHQMMALDATDERSLNGRSQIWERHLRLLDENPSRWLIGSGFGAARDSGSTAHNQLLQVTVEAGLVGLAVFLYITYRILIDLYRYEAGSRAMLWTTVALLVSSLTQETFYPVPALGHFIGFYLCALAIALREPASARPSTAPVREIRL